MEQQSVLQDTNSLVFPIASTYLIPKNLTTSYTVRPSEAVPLY